MIEVEPVILSGRHVILEPIDLQHAQGLYEIGRESGDWAYMPRPALSSLQDAIGWVNESLERVVNGGEVVFALKDSKSGKLMGSTRYMSIRAVHKSLEIGYTWLGKAYQRSAVNTETKLLLLTHAFESIKAPQIPLRPYRSKFFKPSALRRHGKG